MAKEVICIHLGQAGCQVGEKLWELFCEEHMVEPDGRRLDSDAASTAGNEDLMSPGFFQETASGQFVPRAIFVDTDPRSKESIMTSTYRRLFNPEFVIGYKKDCKHNFFEGRQMAHHLKIREDVMDRIRLAADNCENLQGFFMFHSFGGGTGSGVGVEILHALHEQFDKKVIFQPVIYPSSQLSSCIVEPYNCIFATHYTKDVVDLSLMLDNEAAYRMCQKNLNMKDPDFTDLNRIIAQIVSSCTTSLRFPTELNATLGEIVVNLVPEAQFRYPILALSPLRHAARGSHEHFSTAEIITDLFEERNMLCDCTDLKRNRYLSACVLLRGCDSGPRDETTGRPPPMQVNEALSSLHTLMNPRGGYRQPLKFLPWLESGGFKVGMCRVPPVVPKGFPEMAKTERQGCMIGNTTAVRQLFVRQYVKFLKLFYHKAYVWQFLAATGEPDLFFDARDGVRDLIDAYEQLLDKCATAEPGHRLEGATGGRQGNRD